MGCLQSWQASKCTRPSLSKNNLPDEFSLMFQSLSILPFNTLQKGSRLNLSIPAVYLNPFIIAFSTRSVHSLKACPPPSVFSYETVLPTPPPHVNRFSSDPICNETGVGGGPGWSIHPGHPGLSLWSLYNSLLKTPDTVPTNKLTKFGESYWTRKL